MLTLFIIMLPVLAWLGIYGVILRLCYHCSDTDPGSAQTKHAVEIRRALFRAHQLCY